MSEQIGTSISNFVQVHPTHDHLHTECIHKLKYCSICDIVFCTLCHKEWKYNSWTYYPYTMSNGININCSGHN